MEDQDDFKELFDKKTGLMLVAFQMTAIILGAALDDPRVTLIGGVVVATFVTFGVALLRHTWNERGRHRQSGSNDTPAGAYKSPSTRRT